jgi:hypothetical protein
VHFLSSLLKPGSPKSVFSIVRLPASCFCCFCLLFSLSLSLNLNP